LFLGCCLVFKEIDLRPVPKSSVLEFKVNWSWSSVRSQNYGGLQYLTNYHSKPPIQWVLEALSPGIKQPVREADYSPPYSAEVKNAWSYISTPPYVFMAWCLVKFLTPNINQFLCAPK
jgi:hypothetical protein